MEAKIFACSQSTVLAQKIADAYGIKIGKEKKNNFSDGEFQVSFEESIRGRRVFLVGSTNPPSENLMELLLMIDAAKRASARHITAVMPYFGWARQDRKDKPRVPIAAKMVAKILQAAGATRVITMDLHADQIQGFFNVPVDHLYASAVFIPYIKSLGLNNMAIASPDTGGTKRANAYAKFLKTEMVIGYKLREKANEVSEMKIIGNVKGKHVIIVDDIIDTAGTIVKAAEVLMEKGARSVRAIITHPVLSGPAYDRIENSQLTELIVSDTIPLKKKSEKIRVLSVSDIFADVIKKVYNYQSISESFL